MPTGYTAKLHDGDQSFEDYLSGCAHAFGALIELRDSGIDAPIPQSFEPRTYHRDGIQAAEAMLTAIDEWTDKQAEEMALTAWQDQILAYEETEEKTSAIRARYQAMLDKVDAWTPPSEDHEGLKRFMREQIEACASEGSMDYYPIPSKLAGVEFRAQAVAKAIRDIEYHAKGWAEEQERVAGRSEWVRLLLESIDRSRADA